MDDGKDLISSPASDLQSLYRQQQQQQHGGAGGHSPSHLAGVIRRPMPNMNMSATTAILGSIGGGSLAGMQFQMDMDTTPPLLHGNASVPGPPAEPVKRKRGRPRKYGPDGTMKASAAAAAAQQQQQQQRLVSAPPRMAGNSGMEDPAQKKRRGRPPGTGKQQHPAAAAAAAGNNAFAGTSFTPHIITASPSEDVAAKIVAFAKQSSKAAVCVLSATGSVSRAVLRHHPADGANNHHAAIYYEGFYEILSLSGSYSLSQQGGGLSVTLCSCSPERNNVIGGVLGGPLVAASTVQVVLGSFHQGGSRSKTSSKKAAGKQQQAFSSGGQQQQAASPTPSSGQNLTPPSVSVVTGGWPSSGMLFDTINSSVDINSSR